jgi:hypothetical protein
MKKPFARYFIYILINGKSTVEWCWFKKLAIKRAWGLYQKHRGKSGFINLMGPTHNYDLLLWGNYSQLPQPQLNPGEDRDKADELRHIEICNFKYWEAVTDDS